MAEDERNLDITINELAEKTRTFKNEGYRLVQIGCTALPEIFEINYSFDRDYGFVNLKLTVPKDVSGIPSISDIYWSAFLYENEIHDLFGIAIKGMAVDYKGGFYRTKVKSAFRRDNDNRGEKNPK